MSKTNGHAPSLSLVNRLERQAVALRTMNTELKNNQDLRGKQVLNSLSGLVQGVIPSGVNGITTPLNSMNNLAYFNAYFPLTINWTMLTYMYKTHGLLQTAIDMPVLDAFRGGLILKSNQMDSDDMKQIDDRLEHSGIISQACETGIWARLYGGGGLVINTDQDPETPLDIRKATKLEFYAASRWEISSTNRFSEFYLFYGKKIHHTRVLTMSGKAAPYLVKFVLQGWGMSEMERMIEDFNLYLRTKDVIYELLKEAKIDVYQLEHFNEQLSSNAGTEMTKMRVQLMNQFKAYNNAVVMDKEDNFEQKQITFAGLAEVHKQNMVYVASALRMPMTKLFGLSASGFNSGEDDIENYNAMVESEVRQPMRPMLRKILEMICIHEFGDAYDIDFGYKPLRVLGEVEEETVKTSKFNRYNQLYSQGIMDAKEYAELCHSENLIPIEPQAAKTGEVEELPDRGGDEPGTSEEEDVEEETGNG